MAISQRLAPQMKHRAITLALLVGILGPAAQARPHNPHKIQAKRIADELPTLVEENGGQIGKTLQIARADWRATDRDEFHDPGALPDIVGSSFVVWLTPTTIYKAGSWSLFAKHSEVGFDKNGVADSYYSNQIQLHTVELRSAIQDKSGFVGETAFGARRNVDVFDVLSDHLAFLSGPTGGFETASLPMEPAAARVLNGHIGLRIEGIVRALPNGKIANCDMHFSPATLDSPSQQTWYRCFVGADLTRLSYVDRLTGATLLEWKK